MNLFKNSTMAQNLSAIVIEYIPTSSIFLPSFHILSRMAFSSAYVGSSTSLCLICHEYFFTVSLAVLLVNISHISGRGLFPSIHTALPISVSCRMDVVTLDISTHFL